MKILVKGRNRPGMPIGNSLMSLCFALVEKFQASLVGRRLLPTLMLRGSVVGTHRTLRTLRLAAKTDPTETTHPKKNDTHHCGKSALMV
jgi:hypothetical protein